MKKNWRNKLTAGNRQLTRLRYASDGPARKGGRKLLMIVNCPSIAIGISIILMVTLLLTTCTSRNTSKEEQSYTCPMHPQVVRDRPGQCPICGMELVRKETTGEEAKITEDISGLVKPSNEVVVTSIETIKGEFKTIRPTVQVRGIVTYDTRNVYTIPARFGGRLERVYLKYAFQPVQKGQKIADIYSPDLITAQRELVYLLENDGENTALIASARKKLALLGASEFQIENLVKRKEVSNTFAVYSPYSGFVIIDESASSRSAISPPPGAADATEQGMRDMGSPTRAAPTRTMPGASGSFVREGEYVSAGQTLFKVVNASSLRVELDLPVSQAGPIKAGDPVALDYGDGEGLNTSVDFVQPFFGENQEFVKIRVYARGARNLRIGQLVEAAVHVKPIEGLWVPKKAVLDLGLDRIVFVKERDVFKPKKVLTGVRAGAWIQISHGMSPSDEIAANAHFMVDSESFIKTGN